MVWDTINKALTPSIKCRDRIRKFACLFAGLGHLQLLLLATTNSHYLLDRFCMERCCSSEYISRIVTSIIFMEILAIIAVRIAIVIELIFYPQIWKDGTTAKTLVTHTKKEEWYIGPISSAILLLISLGYLQVFYAFTTGGRKGHMHWFYVSLMFQHFLNSLIAGSIGFWDVGLALWYLVTLPMAPIVVFFYQLYIHSWIRSHGPRDVEYIVVECQIWLALLLSSMATIFWTAGYAIPYSMAILENLNSVPSGTGKIKVDTRTINVYTVQPANSEVTISAESGSKTVRVYSIIVTGQTVYPDKEVTVRAAAVGGGQDVKAKVTATVDKSNKFVTIEIEKNPGETLWSKEVTVQSTLSTVTISKITLEAADSANLEKIQVAEATGTTHTIVGKGCYPKNGYYISGLSSASAENTVIGKLWNTKWDGGKCYYAKYYKNGNYALIKLCIIGGDTSVRYYGTVNGITANSWKKIDTGTDFNTNLKELKRTGSLSGITGGSTDATDESNNYNTNFPKAITAIKWELNPLTWKFTPVAYPLLMQGLSVGAVGSIFPNLIPKTLTCPRTTRSLSVINMFLVTLPHIFNVMLCDMVLHYSSVP